MRTIPFRRTFVATSLVGGAAVMLALAGCSSTASGATGSASPTAGSTQGRQGGAPGQNSQDRGGVSGLIAAVSDGVVQVQGDDEQTAVRYTADTAIQKTSTVTSSDISVGDCILAVTGQDSDAATTVTITAAGDDGTCTAGFGGGFGGGTRPSGAPTDVPQGGEGGRSMPSGMPTDSGTGMPDGMPSGAPSGGGFGQFTSGKVTAASAASLRVTTTAQDGSSSTEKVALSSDTKVTATKDASDSDIAEGLCVRATGKADDKGGYDATALVLSDATSDGTCTSGMGFGGRGQRPDDSGSSND